MKKITNEDQGVVANVYTVYDNNKPIFVGKTQLLDDNNKVDINRLGAIYNNKKLYKRVRRSKNIKVRILRETPNMAPIWITEKNEKHKEYLNKKYKLLNSPKSPGMWKGPWFGKKKDQYTIDRLTESKYKPILQFDENGTFLKRWPSAKHAAQHYGVYTLKNGSGSSIVHSVLLGFSRSWNNSVWYKEREIIDLYGTIPAKLKHADLVPNKNPYYIKVYTTSGKLLKICNGLNEASAYTNVTRHYINEILQGELSSAKGFKFKWFKNERYNKTTAKV